MAVSAVLAGASAPPAAAQEPTFTWTGTWSSTFGDMTLTESGSTVEGTYTYDQGHLVGDVSGRTLVGRWDEAPTRTGPTDAGPMELTLQATDLKSFVGQWRHDGDTDWYPGGWNGTCVAGPCLQNGTPSVPPVRPQPAPAPAIPGLGPDVVFAAPQPQQPTPLKSPPLPPGTRTLGIDVRLAGAGAGALGGVLLVNSKALTPTRDLGELLGLCVEFAAPFVPPMVDFGGFGPVLLACEKILGNSFAHPPVTKPKGCPSRVLALRRSAGQPPARIRRQAAARAARLLRVRCSLRSRSLSVRITARGRPSLNRLLGKRARMSIGRASAAGDGPQPQLVVRWRR